MRHRDCEESMCNRESIGRLQFHAIPAVAPIVPYHGPRVRLNPKGLRLPTGSWVFLTGAGEAVGSSHPEDLLRDLFRRT